MSLDLLAVGTISKYIYELNIYYYVLMRVVDCVMRFAIDVMKVDL